MRKNALNSFLACFFVFFGLHSAFANTNLTAILREKSLENDEYNVNFHNYSSSSEYGIIIFEDAHCNEPVQRTLMKLIGNFNNEIVSRGYSEEPLVMQEGGSWGVIDTSILKKDKNSKEVQDFIDEKLRCGEMGAAEYLHTQKSNFVFFGIEEPALYDENYHYFMDIANKRKTTETLLKDLETKLSRLRTLVFSEELNAFYESMQKKEATENLENHLNQIRLYSLQYSVDMKQYPSLEKYFETLKALQKLNTEQIEVELNRFNTVMKTKYSFENVPELFKKGLITLREYPELFKYAKLKEFIYQTKMLDFVKEKEAIEKELLLKIAYTDEEKELVTALNSFFIISKILSFTLTKEEYEYYSDQIKKGINLLTEMLSYVQSYFLTYQPVLNLEELKKSAEGFYTAVNKRDKVLTENVVKALKQHNAKLGILIIGGFHTEGITNRLKEKNISYIVVTPKIKEVDEDSLDTYYEVMTRFWNERQAAAKK